MKVCNFIFFITLLHLADVAFAGGIAVGGGGNVVYCANQTKPMSLDYVLTKDMYGDGVKTVQVLSLKSSFHRIAKLIDKKIPHLSESFSEYVKFIDARGPSGPYVWKPLFNSPEEVYENIPKLPYWCRRFGTPTIYQAVVRYVVKNPDKSEMQIKFEYDEEIYSELQYGTQLQLSFLLLHEWLWNFATSIEQNRQLNYLLHSDLFEKLNADEIQKRIRQIGVAI